MFRRCAIAALTLTLAAAPGIVPTAEAASIELSFGAGFRIGGIFFDLGIHSRGGRYHDHYYRTRHRVHYKGHSCSRACYRHEGYDYHHRSCSVVKHHFHRYGWDEARVYRTYGPDYGYRYDRRPRYDDRHERYDRYDRHHRRYDRYDRRYDRRHDRHERRHHRRHRHDNSCGYYRH